jgi:hypothetical protein
MALLRQFVASWLLALTAVAVCSAQSFSLASPEAAAKVTQLTGQVSVLKDSQPWALQVGSTVQVKQIIVTGSDGFAIFQVSDGSTFEVYPNSKVTFRNNPSNWKDLLDLWIGRVKVHVQRLGGQPNHNRVTTPTAVISVRGTVFDVSVEDEDTTLVAVEEGTVAVQHRIVPSGEPKLVNAGEYVRVYRNQPLADKRVDRGNILRRTLQAASDALWDVIYRNPGSGGGSPGPTGTPTGGRPGDTDNTPPPPPPPDGPPPPPPGI